MMFVRHTGCLLCLLALQVHAGTPPVLHHDPFARPVLKMLGTQSSGSRSANGQWSPQLIAVMVAGKQSLVNLDGTLLKIGDVYQGHRLVKVKDQQAIFRKGRRYIVLKMEISTQ